MAVRSIFEDVRVARRLAAGTRPTERVPDPRFAPERARNVPGEPTQSTPRTPVVEAAGSEYAVRRQETSPPALQQAADALRLTVD